jgi:hypothetical protein
MKGDKTDYSNYRGISLLPATYKVLSNILFSRLNPYAEEFIGDHQSGFRRNESTVIYSVFVKYLRKMGTQRRSASALYRLQESL